MIKKSIWLVVALVIIGGAIFAFLNRQPVISPEKLLSQYPQLFAYTVNNEATGQLNFSVAFAKASEESYLVDLAVDLDHNQELSGGEWLLQNQPVRLIQNLRNNFLIADQEKKLKPGSDVLIKINLKNPASDKALETVEKTVTLEIFELADLLGFNVPGATEQLKRAPGWPKILSQKVLAQTEEVFRNANTPDLAQGRMECGAVSAANNLMSLAGENGRLADLPEFTGDLIEELKTDMKFNNGILLPDMVPGKNAFAARHNLPISSELKFAPTIDDLTRALQSGAAVELSMNFTRSASGRQGTGHVVTLVGASANQVFVHDSGTPEGMDTLDLNSIIRTNSGDFLGIDYPLWDGIAYIDAIVIQNWTEPKQAQESYTDGGEQGSEIEVLVINGSYFPKSQFIVANPDACNASHYHAHQPVWGLKTQDSTETISLNDPNPSACGFGKVSEVPVEFITISFEQSQQLIRYLP